VHIERYEGAPNLPEIFRNFVLRQLRGRALDDNFKEEAEAGEFPDFACYRDVVLIEVKHLESDQTERIDEVFRREASPHEMPVFFGARDGRLITRYLSNGKDIEAKIASKLGRTIEAAIAKANRQFASYRQRHPRKNVINICVLLNSKLRELTPSGVLHSIHAKVVNGGRRFSEIDAIVYISEKHMTILPDGRLAFGIGVFENVGAINSPWKMEVVNRILTLWSSYRTGADVQDGREDIEFSVIDDISSYMKKSDLWTLEYKRDPYLQAVKIEILRFIYNRSLAILLLQGLKGAWAKPAANEVDQALRTLQHVIEETNKRGLDLRLLERHLLTPEEKAKLLVGLPAEFAQKIV